MAVLCPSGTCEFAAFLDWWLLEDRTVLLHPMPKKVLHGILFQHFNISFKSYLNHSHAKDMRNIKPPPPPSRRLPPNIAPSPPRPLFPLPQDASGSSAEPPASSALSDDPDLCVLLCCHFSYSICILNLLLQFVMIGG